MKKMSIIEVIVFFVIIGYMFFYTYKFYDNNYVYDEKGFNKKAINKETKTKYDEKGFDINGLDEEGFDKKGKNIYGIHKSYKNDVKIEKDKNGDIVINIRKSFGFRDKIDMKIKNFNEKIDELNKLEPVFGWGVLYRDKIVEVMSAYKKLDDYVLEKNGILLDFYLTKDRDMNYWLNINFDFIAGESEIKSFKITWDDSNGKRNLEPIHIELNLSEKIIPIFSEEVSPNYYDWIARLIGGGLYYHKYTSRVMIDEYLLKILEQKEINIYNKKYLSNSYQKRVLSENEIIKLKELLYISLKKEY